MTKKHVKLGNLTLYRANMHPRQFHSYAAAAWVPDAGAWEYTAPAWVYAAADAPNLERLFLANKEKEANIWADF
jgi:hypothetical protein